MPRCWVCSVHKPVMVVPPMVSEHYTSQPMREQISDVTAINTHVRSNCVGQANNSQWGAGRAARRKGIYREQLETAKGRGRRKEG